MTEKHLTDQKFTEFSLDENLLRAVAELGFDYCTPIQAKTLPIALAGGDVAGQAQTGTGKTAAFLLALFDKLVRTAPRPDADPKAVRALILAPTRELAIQIHRDAEDIGKYAGLRLGLVYGGTGYEQQRNLLNDGVDVLIGTPGRLIDYFKQGAYTLRQLEVLVLDEADRMFDLGFIKDIRYLLRRMPPPAERLSMLYSATLSLRVNELAYEHMNNPQTVKIETDKITAEEVHEVVYYPANEEKIALLIGLLRKLEIDRALVFVNTKVAADNVYAWLKGNNFNPAILSGDIPQNKRERLLDGFKSGKHNVLVATDVAARGLHIEKVSHVFNYDLPQDPEDYVHRVGRTARAGAKGDAISFACEKYAMSLMDIEDFIGHSLKLEKMDPGLLAELEPADHSDTRRDRVDRRSERGRGGGRNTGRGKDGPKQEKRDSGRRVQAAANDGPSEDDRARRGRQSASGEAAEDNPPNQDLAAHSGDQREQDPVVDAPPEAARVVEEPALPQDESGGDGDTGAAIHAAAPVSRSVARTPSRNGLLKGQSSRWRGYEVPAVG